MLAIETSTEACSVALWIDGEVRERFEIAPRRHTELVLPWAGELLADAGIGKSQLDAIAVGRGPGAFTGVRLAVALVQGMALALDLPVLPVSTLAALALPAARSAKAHGQATHNAAASDHATHNDIERKDEAHSNAMHTDAGCNERAPNPLILAAIDARMGELYLGLFRCDPDRLLIAERDEWMAPPSAPDIHTPEKIIGVGTGFAAEANGIVSVLGTRLQRFDADALPRATDIARLAALAYARGEAITADQLEPAYLRNKVALTLAEQARRTR